MSKYTFRFFMINGERLTLGNAACKYDLLVDSLMVMHPGDVQEIDGVKVQARE